MQRHAAAAAHKSHNDASDIERSPLLGARNSSYQSSTASHSSNPSFKRGISTITRGLIGLAVILITAALLKRVIWSYPTLPSHSIHQYNTDNLHPSSLDPTILVDSDIAQLLLESDTNSTYIPDIVHYIIGATHSSRDGRIESKPEFSLLNYLSIKSASDVLQANDIYCHVVNEPEGEWWQKAKSKCTKILSTRSIQAVFGRSVTHKQHKTGILRLEALLQYGGIIAELDVIFLKSVKSNPDQYQLYFQLPLLLSHAMSAAVQWYDRFDTSIVAARPGHPFIREWLTAYKHFTESSTEQLANEANHKVAILTHELNRFSNKIANHLHTLRPQHAYTLPTKEMPGWGQPYAAEANGQTMLYDPQTLQSFMSLENQIAIHCWQGENEMIVEQLDDSGKVQLVTSRYSGNLYEKFLLKNTQDVCTKADTTNYGRIARIAMLSARSGTTPAHTC